MIDEPALRRKLTRYGIHGPQQDDVVDGQKRRDSAGIHYTVEYSVGNPLKCNQCGEVSADVRKLRAHKLKHDEQHSGFSRPDQEKSISGSGLGWENR